MMVTTDEAAELAGISPSTIRSWVLRGLLEPVRRGAKPLRFRYDDVAEVQLSLRSDAWKRRHAEQAQRWRDACSRIDGMQR